MQWKPKPSFFGKLDFFFGKKRNIKRIHNETEEHIDHLLGLPLNVCFFFVYLIKKMKIQTNYFRTKMGRFKKNSSKAYLLTIFNIDNQYKQNPFFVIAPKYR